MLSQPNGFILGWLNWADNPAVFLGVDCGSRNSPSNLELVIEYRDRQPTIRRHIDQHYAACLCAGGGHRLFYYAPRVIRAVNMVILRSKATWDDVFMRYRVLEKLAMLVPAIVLNLLVPITLTEHPVLSSLVDRLLSIWLVILMIRAIYAGLDAVNEISDVNLVSRRLPVKALCS